MTNEASSSSTSSDRIDMQAVFNSAREFATNPRLCLGRIKSMATDAEDYFTSDRDGGLNSSLGFFIAVLLGLFVFRLLQSVFSMSVIGFFLAIPSTLIFAILYLAISVGLIHLIAATLGQSKESFWQGAIVVTQLSWLILIWEFPLWVLLPNLVKALVTIASYFFWAHLAIPATAIKYGITTGKHVIPFWAISGVFSFIVLIGVITGTAADKAGNYVTAQLEEAQAAVTEAVQQADEQRKAWLAEAKSNPDFADLNLKTEIAVRQANFINAADEKDINRINNIGGNSSYEPNKTQLQYGLDAITVLSYLESDPARSDQKKQIESALKKLERFREAYLKKQLELAAAPPKQTTKKSSSQILWLNGSRYCEITKSGQVWIRSNKVGDIESNGKIWVQSFQRGSIEKNGDVWHNGRKVGSITDKGEVWKGGRKIGLIEDNGKVWIGGSPKGEIVGDGDIRRAAIVYFFDFY